MSCLHHSLNYLLLTPLSSGFKSAKNIKMEVLRCVILPVILCRQDTCSVTLNEELRLIIFEKRVLRRNLGLRDRKDRGLESCLKCRPILIEYDGGDEKKRI